MGRKPMKCPTCKCVIPVNIERQANKLLAASYDYDNLKAKRSVRLITAAQALLWVLDRHRMLPYKWINGDGE